MGENLLVPGFPIVSPLPVPLPHQAVGALRRIRFMNWTGATPS